MAASDEQLALDGLALNIAGGTYEAEEMRFTPAKKRLEWLESSDGDGAPLVRDPKHENSMWELVLNVHGTTRDLAHDAVKLIVDKLEEAERFGPGGIPLVWTPANSTDSLTFYVLSGEITQIPIGHDTGYFSSAPNLKVALTLYCKPFGYGAEVTTSSNTVGSTHVTLTIASVTGDVPAEARFIVTDNATQPRDFVAWGLEHRYQAATDLLLIAGDLTTTGFVGASSTYGNMTGANTWMGLMDNSIPLAIVGTGNQPHVGLFRVYARVAQINSPCQTRFTWQVGDGPYTSNQWHQGVGSTLTSEFLGLWQELDLGLINIPPTTLGTQRWRGQVEAQSLTDPDAEFHVDYLLLVPVTEGFGKATRVPVAASPTTYVVRDTFLQTAGNLNAKTAPTGGNWATSGATTDLAIVAGALVQRSTVSDTIPAVGTAGGRHAVSGMTASAAQGAQVDLRQSVATSLSPAQQGLLMRWTSSTTGMVISVYPSGVDGNVYIVGRIFNGGTEVNPVFRSDVPYVGVNEWARLRCEIDAAGRFAIWYGASISSEPTAFGQHSALATGGALATGKCGFYDWNFTSNANTRQYDNFYSYVPAAGGVVFPSQSIEFRSDDTLREDSSGTYWGQPQRYRGAPFFLPPAGDEARSSRVVAMTRRHNIEQLPAEDISDSTTIQVKYTPRYLYLPR